MELYNRLCTITKQENVMKDEPMKKHTTFRIGGPADYFVTPESKEEIQAIVELCKKEEIPYSVIGNGSNLLVGDKGYRGVILQIFKKMNQIRVEENKIYAGAGALLSKIAATALSESLTGFEFAAGIPGTLGGAVRMNAGAYGGEMKQVLESVEVMTADGEFLTIPVEEMGLAYRTSVVEQKNYIVLEAVISLEKGNPEKIKEVMDDLKEKRVTKQPLEYASAGSTFKRPEGYFAGKLIGDAGLRGFRVGDAQVSEKHCGFVINRGNASAAEIMELMRQVEDKVEENSIGHVQIAGEVIAIIAGLAATEVDGVSRLAGSLSNELASRLGKKNPAKGVKVELLPGEVKVDLAIDVLYEYSIPTVTTQVQDKVKQAIETMTGLNVTKVNIRVAGVRMADAN